MSLRFLGNRNKQNNVKWKIVKIKLNILAPDNCTGIAETVQFKYEFEFTKQQQPTATFVAFLCLCVSFVSKTRIPGFGSNEVSYPSFSEA